MSSRKRAIAVLILGVLLGGCSGGSRPASFGTEGASPPSSSAASSSTTPSASPTLPGSSTPTHPRPTAGSVPSSQTSSPASLFSARLDKACVARGLESDKQGLTVKGPPKYAVVYSTVYSDNQSEWQHPEYKVGHGSGQTDDNGSFRAQWVVPPTAPEGPAEVWVGVAGAGDTVKLPFRVVASGSCP